MTLDEATPGKLEQGSGRIKFFLGNSCIVDDPEEAAELLIQREFPDAGEPDAEPLFIPDFFTSTKPRCLDLDFEKEHGRLSKGEISHVAGEAAERALYDSLKKFFSSSGDGRDQKGIMVLYSWQNEWKRNLETDFLIVSPIHKVIAVIEVKLREAQAKVQDAKAEIAGSGKVNQRKRAKKKQSCAEKIDERKVGITVALIPNKCDHDTSVCPCFTKVLTGCAFMCHPLACSCNTYFSFCQLRHSLKKGSPLDLAGQLYVSLPMTKQHLKELTSVTTARNSLLKLVMTLESCGPQSSEHVQGKPD